MLVNAKWVRIGRPASFDDPMVWEPMEDDDLYWHTIDFLIPDLDEDRLGWFSGSGRLQRSALGRRIVPPPHGGASREAETDLSERARSVFLENLSDVDDQELAELKDRALSGYDINRERNSTVEQRANFFLGAAGLSSTLVLANASVLLGVGNGALNAPWRQLSAAALAVASFCAIAAGIRAMQAVMLAFGRVSPTSVEDAFNWRETPGSCRVARSHLTALLVAQERELWIGNWKLERLSEARRWFGGAVLGVVVVTGFVLAEML